MQAEHCLDTKKAYKIAETFQYKTIKKCCVWESGNEFIEFNIQVIIGLSESSRSLENRQLKNGVQMIKLGIN